MKILKNAFLYIGGAFGLPNVTSAQSKNALLTPRKTARKRGKLCLQCGITHTHNNSFCSAFCCKEWNLNNPLKGRKL